MKDEIKVQRNVKQRILHETLLLFIYTVFLFILFSIFNIYQRLLLGDFGNSHIRYGYSLIEALILAKVILIGQSMELGEKFKRQPLIIPVIYKTLIFTLLLLIFTIIEHYIVGFFAGHTITQTYQEVMQQKINIILAKNFIIVIIFAQFFVVQELSEALGEKKLYTLFFKKSDKVK